MKKLLAALFLIILLSPVHAGVFGPLFSGSSQVAPPSGTAPVVTSLACTIALPVTNGVNVNLVGGGTCAYTATCASAACAGQNAITAWHITAQSTANSYSITNAGILQGGSAAGSVTTGSYTVTVTATNSTGTSPGVVQSISVFQPPVVASLACTIKSPITNNTNVVLQAGGNCQYTATCGGGACSGANAISSWSVTADTCSSCYQVTNAGILQGSTNAGAVTNTTSTVSVIATNAGGNSPAVGQTVTAITAPAITNQNVSATLPLTTGQTIATMLASPTPTSWAITAVSGDGGSTSDFSISSSGVITTTSSAPTDITAPGTITISMTATNATGTSPTGTATLTVKNSGALPPGVSLQAIDGETITSPTTMSNNYYSRNNFTFAHNAAFSGSFAGQTVTYTGWDDPRFFPISTFLKTVTAGGGGAGSGGTPSQYAALGLNFMWAAQSNVNLSLIGATSGIWLMQTTEVSTQTGPLAGTGNETVGILTFDEPTTYDIGVKGSISGAGASGSTFGATNAFQDHRFWSMGNTASWIVFGALNSSAGEPNTTFNQLFTPVATPNSTTRHIDWHEIDNYFFASTGNSSVLAAQANLLATPGATADQAGRGSNYGTMIDQLRAIATNNANPANAAITAGPTSWNTFTNVVSTIPITVPVETGGPYTPTTGTITPRELNWSVWQTLIHGARAVLYFDFSFSGPANGSDLFGSGGYLQTVQSGQSVSMNTQVAATDLFVTQLAPVLNSPFAKGYVTVSPAASQFAGIDVMSKWYQGGNVTNAGLGLTNGFYIFSSPRTSETATNISATFTVAGTATTATVVGEGRTIPISGGTFTDTFATGSTVHIYQIS